jgi:hypothetical protein
LTELRGFGPNWNVGILELWNNGFWENGSLIYRQKSFLTGKPINGKLPFNINIPLFQMRGKNPSLNNPS